MSRARRHLAFAAGDLVLLTTATALAGVAVSVAHPAVGPFVLAALVGMIGGMAMGMLAASLAAPLPGSIETMIAVSVASFAWLRIYGRRCQARFRRIERGRWAIPGAGVANGTTCWRDPTCARP